MTKREVSLANSSEIEAAASDWLVRRESGRWTPADRQSLEKWLEASTLHRVAFLRLELAWEESARLKALGAGIDSDRPPPPGRWNLSPIFSSRAERLASPAASRRQWLVAVAATLLLALGAGGYLALAPSGDRYATPVGGIASVPMADGSKVMLNTDSEILVAVTDTERRVELSRGEAFFEVAKDPTRPFVVRAGDKRVTAVGTKFSVRRDGGDVQVVVTEGRVRLEDAFATRSAVSGTSTDFLQGAAEMLLTPGSVARAGESGVLVQRKSLSEAEMQLSWRVGVLTFREERLADAIAEFNRYSTRKVVIGDAAVAELRVEGNFRSNNVEAFVRLLESGFPVRASAKDDHIVLTTR